MDTEADWKLVAEAHSSFEFLRSIVEPENQSLPVNKAISKHTDANGIPPLRPGALIAFAYISIVYPTEKAIYGIPNTIDISAFTETIPSGSIKELAKKLRNALSHGDFEVTTEDIIFNHKDWNATIKHENFTVFLHDYFIGVAAQQYIGRAQKNKDKH